MYSNNQLDTLSRVTLSVPLSMADREILTPEAIEFISLLTLEFADRRRKLLARRAAVQHEINLGIMPGFPAAGDEVRRGVWRVRPFPVDLADRHVEVRTSAADGRLLRQSMNSGANICVADFEDLQSPTWVNIVESQRNLRDLLSEPFSLVSDRERAHRGTGRSTTVGICPRGWHLAEGHFYLDGEPIPASLFDFGLFVFHNGRVQSGRAMSTSIHIPKIENRFEATLWNDVFDFAERYLSLPAGSIRATILIETLPAAFEIDEILFELRDRTTALSFNRKNYIFSIIKKFHNFSRYTLPDRELIGADTALLDACLVLMVQTAHRRGAHAVSGLLWEPDTTGTGRPTDILLERFSDEVARDIRLGADGLTVTQDALARIARESISSSLQTPNQLHVVHEDVTISREDLLNIPTGPISDLGVRSNIQSTIRYLETWLGGRGTLSHRSMWEDTATAEIARSQIWHWLQHSKRLSDGNILDRRLFRKYFTEETEKIREDVGPDRYRRGQFDLASRLLFNMAHQQDFQEFHTTPTYQFL